MKKKKITEIKVTFQPSGRGVYVLPGTLLLEAAGRAGVALQTPCGGQGTCGKCRVRILEGAGEPTSPDRRCLSPGQIQKGYRLACRTYIHSPLTVEIPPESRFESSQKILTGHAGRESVLNPVVKKISFRLSPPAREDTASDVTRLKAAIGDVILPFPLLRNLPKFLREQDWRGTAVVSGGRLLALEAGDTSRNAFGIAVDLGTTTMVGVLFDLVSGQEKAVFSAMNPQVGFGDDVVSRISRVRENNGALGDLQEAALNAVNTLVRALSERAGVNRRHIYEIVLAGNSSMQQLFCGLDPSALGEVPFVQVFDESLTLPARTLGLGIHPAGEVFVFPQIGGFVGGDTVAGMLASGLEKTKTPTLMVDIGTNGEIVLAHDGVLQATSTAAGPAFEGARIVQGMRAGAGAIEKVIVSGDDVVLNVIGNTRPVGLCGTALIDVVAELLRNGILDATGRILPAEEVPTELPDPLKARLVPDGPHTSFLLAAGAETASGEDIRLWQKDVREIQLATGAIRAGINILLRRSGLEPADLGHVLLAGGFGNFIRRNNARRIGLLPRVPCEKIRFIGNASLYGAKLALLSGDEREHTDLLRRQSEHVDLSLDPEFQMEFGMAMIFPGEDMDRFQEK